jgi:hypothetical protein
MKKKYLILAGILVLAVTTAGCGSKDTQEQEVEITVTPTPEEDDSDSLVDMQQTPTDEYSDITNIIGENTATASRLVLTNQMGSEIAAIYIRPNTDDDDEWGDELIQNKFTLKNGEKALYYYEKDQKDEDGNAITSFDIRISYTDSDKNECFFRKLPLTTITKITLRMDGTGEDGIPYATYTTGSTEKEYSTLNEVKQRLGLLDSDEDEEDDTQEQQTPTPAPTQAAQAATPTPTEVPQEVEEPSTPDPGATQARNYIGQSLDSLIGACGSPTSSEYQDEPESGKTGYHYYDTFTVSTTIDDNGNEVVAGVW